MDWPVFVVHRICNSRDLYAKTAYVQLIFTPWPTNGPTEHGLVAAELTAS